MTSKKRYNFSAILEAHELKMLEEIAEQRGRLPLAATFRQLIFENRVIKPEAKEPA